MVVIFVLDVHSVHALQSGLNAFGVTLTFRFNLSECLGLKLILELGLSKDLFGGLRVEIVDQTCRLDEEIGRTGFFRGLSGDGGSDKHCCLEEGNSHLVSVGWLKIGGLVKYKITKRAGQNNEIRTGRHKTAIFLTLPQKTPMGFWGFGEIGRAHV